MPVVIRLSRKGTKHVPYFRVVVVDSRKKCSGEVLETIGTYDALKASLVTFKSERYDAWVQVGAQPSDTAKKLYRLYKKQNVSDVPKSTPKKKVETKSKEEVKASKPAQTADIEKENATSSQDVSQG